MEQTILNSKEGNIMQNRSINSLVIILISSLLLSACSMSDWQNEHYATKAALTNAYNERAAYYAAESPDIKALREKSHPLCWSEAAHGKDRFLFTPVYDRGMRRRDTPMQHDRLDK